MGQTVSGPSLEPLLRLWGKARPAAQDGPRWHPLIYHSLDVAAVGERLLEARPSAMVQLAARLGCRAETLTRLVIFLLALHDTGKLSRPFQAKVPELWPENLLGRLGPAPPRDPGHTTTGAWLLQRSVAEEIAPLFPGWGDRTADLLAPFVGHHGRPVPVTDTRSEREMFGGRVVAAARAFLATIQTLFQPQPLAKPEAEAIRTVTWELAGLAVVADWIGSSQTWFPYEAPERDPRVYLDEIARPRAADAVRQAGIAPARASAATGYRAITQKDHRPSPIQHWAESAALPEGPFVAFIEDVTGGGKTEAALILAHRLLAEGRARGLYLALPTMATANAMYERLGVCYRRLFADGETPSLALAHGRARLHPGFRAAVEGVADPRRASEGEAEAEADASGAACAAWLADESRKAFLAEIGVGTIDQAFLGVLPAKYQALRLFGLAERVLIVDEAHAYDAYMGRELERLLEFQAAQGGNAIVLSATLPRLVRRSLAAAFARGLGTPPPVLEAAAYPLVTMVAGGIAAEEAMAPRAELRRTLAIERLPDAATALDRIRQAAEAGAAIAWVRNTVDDALDGVAQLAAIGVRADLFHARFAMGDRLEIEHAIVRRFGKDGDPAERPGVLVATQVIEQSLDLDFDLLVSDLAPIDLLLQRAGRLWRHPGRARRLGEARLLVVSPDPDGEIGPDWYHAAFPRAAWVYRNHALLWLSALALFDLDRLEVPEDVRPLVERVYGDAEPEAWAPNALQGSVMKALGEAQAGRALAQTNLLVVVKGYGGDHPGWDDEARVPTRLGEETTTLRLARVEGERLVPWCPDPDPHRAWALSEVTVRARRVTGMPEPPPGLGAAIAAARRTWTRHDERKLLLPLAEQAPGLWQSTVLAARAEPQRVIYSRGQGLCFDRGSVDTVV
jgi:CRISPR-associated endonuclease/helicase Cas3